MDELNKNIETQLESLSEPLKVFRKKQQVEDAILQHIEQSQRKAKRKRLLTIPLYGTIAASLTAIGFFITQKTAPATFSSQSQSTICYLPDSSTVILNPNSEIQFDKSTWANKRHVNLKGSALFDVKKGNKFSVQADEIQINVHGTQFLVQKHNTQTTVACLSGCVSVKRNQDKDEIFLQPQERVQAFPSQTLMKEKSSLISASDRTFEYIDANLCEILDQISTIHKTKIDISKNIMHLRYTGIVPVYSLNRALDIITNACNLTYRTQDSIILIIPN